ncbi:FAD-dependent monooxygenase [Aliidiomarina sp.]|uniref:FAD-dependent monooxygenase n=1 Tax=Aliidiomarina sp. TaxID=1872439 RepID=UPI003A4DF5E1
MPSNSRANAKSSVDIAIAGGGLTGCLAALVMHRRFPQANIVLIDQQNGTPQQDPRGLALALRTQQVLAEYGVWQGELAKSPAIQHIHVSDANSPGSTMLHAQQEGIDALGYVAMAGLLQQELSNACARASTAGNQTGSFEHLQGTAVASLAAENTAMQLKLSDGQELAAKLLVVAEGSNSPTRAMLGVQMQREAYAQVAVAARVEYAQQHGNVAYERFTAEGPAALLPQGSKHAALVWCMHPERAAALQQQNDADRTRAVQDIFGAAPGRIVNCEYQATFPLQLAMAERFIGHRSVIIGNACHTLHPVAGQGYNLGVRDILDLAKYISAEDAGAMAGLNAYQQQRQRDYAEIIGLTHGLVAVFSNQDTLWRNIRSKGLYALRSCSLLSKPLMRKAMGFRTLW